MSKQEQGKDATFGYPVEHVQLAPSLISAALSGTPEQVAEHAIMRPAFLHELTVSPQVIQEFARWDVELGLVELRAEIRALWESGGTIESTDDEIQRRLEPLLRPLPGLAIEYVSRLNFPWRWLARDLCELYVLRVGLDLTDGLEVGGSVREIPRSTTFTIDGTAAERRAQLEELARNERRPQMRSDTPARIQREARWLVQAQVQGITHYQLAKRSGHNQTKRGGYNQTQVGRAIEKARRCLEVATFS